MRRTNALVLAGTVCSSLLLEAQSAPSRSPSRLDMLERWVEAVERHEPGTADGPATDVGTWSQTELQRVWVDVRSVISLIRDPGVSIFFIGPDWVPASSRRTSGSPAPAGPLRKGIQVVYSRSELGRIRALSSEVARRGGENRVLKRGAMLHADIAMLEVAQGASRAGRTAPGTSLVTLRMTDGRPLGLDTDVNHLEMGRRLLGEVSPSPSRDETVRLWYLAIGSLLQSRDRLDLWHFERALEVFSTDADVLFFAGCLREELAGARIQAAIRTATVPRDLVILDIRSEEAELRQAERLFRRALQQEPNLAEARVRLGRVLGRLGRHADAAAELRRAISSTENRLLLYYGSLFLGAQAEALTSLDEARRSYERAASLYPRAQSPRLALSRLEAQAGNLPAARAAVQGVMTQAANVDDGDDPWWTYHLSQARGADRLMDQLRQSFRGGDLR